MIKYSSLVLGYYIRIFKLKIKNSSKGFTLIELLVVIAIIGILIGVLVPSMSRSLSGNRLASDVEVLRAKLEETRLLAGSTQTNDENNLVDSEVLGTDRVGYYGILIPGSDVIKPDNIYNSRFPFYAIVRLSDPFAFRAKSGYCSGNQALTDAINNNMEKGTCLIEKIGLTDGVTYKDYTTYNIHAKLIAFKVPTQQVSEIYCPVPCGPNGETNYVYTLLEPPLFLQREGFGPNNPVDPPSHIYLKLQYNNKVATIKAEPYTGKLTVEYNDE
ncbi:MAG: type II secretion system GspH family protein [Candidatus Berkelbacteria bacterium]|nr:type II secretion system GspH family protein [Candidatus Berkelbacteria bacterium]